MLGHCKDFGTSLDDFKQGSDMTRPAFLEDYSVRRINYIEAYAEQRRPVRRLLQCFSEVIGTLTRLVVVELLIVGRFGVYF